MFQNNPRKQVRSTGKVRIRTYTLPLAIDIVRKRNAAIRAANVARKKYAHSLKEMVNEVYPAGPSVLKSKDGVRIVATRNMEYGEPTFG